MVAQRIMSLKIFQLENQINIDLDVLRVIVPHYCERGKARLRGLVVVTVVGLE